jgi:hypothetical protein
MGGGDLNMKKSWHPLLQKNQERVWQEENKAREERKRIEQKRKEIAEERQLQELQRLQESQGGKPRTERLDWMYTAPGTGSQAVGEQLEQYLLGKKGVQELIMGDENEKLKKGDTGFIAVQNANSVSDTRNKVLNDPLLAIKKQEQRKFEELMKNPIMLKQMKKEMEKKNGIKQEDGEKKRHHHHKSHRHEHRSERRHRDKDDREKRHGDRSDSRGQDSHRPEKRHRVEEERYEGRRRDDDYPSESRHRDDDSRSSKSRKYDDKRDYDDRRRDRSPRPSARRSSPSIKREPSPHHSDDSRAAALKAMLDNADDLESSRAVRLTALEQKEKAEQERDDRERFRTQGLGGRAGFMKDMQNRILEEGRMAAVR